MDHRWGALSLPLADTNATDFSSLDPARDVLLNMLASAISAELLPRWPDAVNDTALEGSLTPVKHKLPFEPDPELLQQLKAEFPLLCIYRESEDQTVEEWSLTADKLTSKWGVDYFLGPLDAGRRGKLNDVLHAVGKIVACVIRDGGHTSYTVAKLPSGTTHLVLAQTCGFFSVNVTKFRCGPAQFTPDGPRYWACSLTLETTELASNTATPAAFTGVEATLGTGNADGLDLDLLVVDTDSADEIWPDA